MLEVYLAACALIAWIGRRRILGFWGNFIVAFLVSPLVVAIIIFAGSARPKAPSPPVTTVGG
jgi:hypothetical protein